MPLPTHVDLEEVEAEGNPNFNGWSNLSTILSAATYFAAVKLLPEEASLYLTVASLAFDLGAILSRRYQPRTLVADLEAPLGSERNTYTKPNKTQYGRLFAQTLAVGVPTAAATLIVNSDHDPKDSIKTAALAGTISSAACQVYEAAKSCVGYIRRCNG